MFRACLCVVAVVIVGGEAQKKALPKKGGPIVKAAPYAPQAGDRAVVLVKKGEELTDPASDPPGKTGAPIVMADSRYDMVKAIKVKDDVGLKGLFKERRLGIVPDGRKVLVLSLEEWYTAKVTLAEVRLEDGPMAGTVLWMFANHIGKAPD